MAEECITHLLVFAFIEKLIKMIHNADVESIEILKEEVRPCRDLIRKEVEIVLTVVLNCLFVFLFVGCEVEDCEICVLEIGYSTDSALSSFFKLVNSPLR